MTTYLITGSTAWFESLSMMSSTVHLAFHVEIDKINKKLSTSSTDKTTGMPVLVLSCSRCTDPHLTNRYLLSTLKILNISLIILRAKLLASLLGKVATRKGIRSFLNTVIRCKTRCTVFNKAVLSSRVLLDSCQQIAVSSAKQ